MIGPGDNFEKSRVLSPEQLAAQAVTTALNDFIDNRSASQTLDWGDAAAAKEYFAQKVAELSAEKWLERLANEEHEERVGAEQYLTGLRQDGRTLQDLKSTFNSIPSTVRDLLEQEYNRLVQEHFSK